MAAMGTHGNAPRFMKVNTLEGGVFTVQVLPTNTIEELKAMLHEKKHCEDPIERQILQVKVLVNTLLVDDDQTLESAGLLHAESEVTAIFSRNEVEAAAKEEIHAKGLLHVNIPTSLTEIPAKAFQAKTRWSRWQSPSLWRPLGILPLQIVSPWVASLSPTLWRSLQIMPLKDANPWRVSLSPTLWHSLGVLPLTSVNPWRASLSPTLWRAWGALQNVSPWPASRSLSQSQRFMKIPFKDANLWRVSLSPTLWRSLGILPLQIVSWQTSPGLLSHYW